MPVRLTATSGRPPANKWLGLTVVCFGTMMSFLNITQTVSVLGPIQNDLHASSADLVWIASVYSMAVASLVMSAGTFGDRFGRRRIFAVGAAILGAGSLLTFLAASTTVVIIGQALAGFGGAMVIPNALALVSHAFQEPHERSRAIAIWATVSGIGLAVGPLIAGGLIKVTSWNSVFLVNVAMAVIVLIAMWPLVQESRHPTRKLDPLGAILTIIAVGALNYGVIEGGNDGYGTTKIIIAFIVTILAVGAFVLAERNGRSPMLDIQLFSHRTFVVANLSAFMAQYAFVGIAIAEVLWFEQVRQDSILSTGLRLLPLMGVYVLISTPASLLARRVGFKVTIALGLVFVAIGTLVMTQQTTSTSGLTTAVLLGLVGAGCALALPSTIAAAVLSVAHAEGGMASATVNTLRQLGSALGASITGTIITTEIASRLPEQLARHGVPAAARPGITQAFVAGQSAASAPANLRAQIGSAAGTSFAEALHVAVFSIGAGAVVMMVATLIWIASRPTPATEAEAAPGPSTQVNPTTVTASR